MGIRKRGASFVADYYDGDGRRRWKTFKKEREARDFEAKVRGEIARGEHVPEAEMPKFSEVAKRFIAAKHGKARDLTVTGYKDVIDTFLAPYFGSLRLNRISVALIESFRSELRTGLPTSIVEARAERLAALSTKRAERTGNRKLEKSVGYFRARLSRKPAWPIL